MTFLKKRILKAALLIMLGVAFVSTEALAQDTTSDNSTTMSQKTISGKVTDGSSNALSGIEVAIVGKDVTATTDKDGKFSFGELQPGTYTVKVEADGYKTWKQEVALTAEGKKLQIKLEAGTSDSDSDTTSSEW